MNNCLILFALSGILWLLFKLFEELMYKCCFKYERRIAERIFRWLTNVTEFMAYAIFLITLVFAIYIFIFQYTPSLYFS